MTDPRGAVEAVWRIESARVTATLAGITHDVGLAEELAQDALVAALEQWPTSGVPDNPGAWLTAVGKRRAVDALRKRQRWQRRLDEVGRDPTTGPPPVGPDVDTVVAGVDDDIGDDRLRLVFTACHPVLPVPSRVALTLRLLGGLTTAEIARAFLAPEPTVAQRISRAKATLARERVPFAVPSGAELAPRLASVTEVVYLIFNEGYAATSGGDWMRPGLCVEALRLGRVLARLAPAEPEVHGLVALMELQHSRGPARTGTDG
ncbi:RNA polymerase sigma factor, partial [Saccharomonospora iraqiensis]|uniref:RNA polymerase sigma factor n=1 Tax=Saccharomonospora iraqiensis TaxID=52698 RepID=UPI001F178B91